MFYYFSHRIQNSPSLLIFTKDLLLDPGIQTITNINRMIKIKDYFVYVLVLSLAFTDYLNAQNWQSLLPEKIDEWRQLGGEANYTMENGVLVGTTVANTPNTFLATPNNYQDFILEFEVMVDPSFNSGVQIRSNSLKDYRDGRVHGYQVEIDPSTRGYSAGIYDEARRGWLYPLSVNSKGRKAFLNGQWNKYRVEAIGNTIRTWLNGVQCANLVDDLTSSGFIAYQVHSVKDEDQVGKQVKWRNARILTEDLEKYRTPQDPEVPERSYLINTLTDHEKRTGWRLLWDGKTSEGWRGAKRSDFPEKGWVINEGVLTVEATDGGESTGPGDIVTDMQFSDFELELEFMITEGANSGIKYFVQTSLNQGAGSAIGCEFQLLDDKVHPDAKLGVSGNRTLAGLYDLIPPGNLSVQGSAKRFNGVGSWNKARIVSKGGKVSHWLNNEKTLEYHRHTPMFEALVAYSKYQKWENFGQWPEGHILLQDHGDTVHFRNIKIREF